MIPRTESFPREAVRDLLGIVRAMYFAAKQGNAPALELKKIARVGADLRHALELAATSRPGTLGFSAAWRTAEDATLQVGELVNALTPAEPLVVAAQARVAGARAALRTKPLER